MRKSFTRFFGFLLLSVFMLFSSALKADEIQKTVELYAETVPTACYNESNSYAAKISVKDFIGIKSFQLTMKYNASVFTAGSASTIADGSVLTGVSTTVTESGSVGTVVITWTNATAQTIGDNVIKNILSVPFSIDGFPNNSGTNSFTSNLTWDAAGTNFYYDEASASPRTPVLTVNRYAGSMGVSVTYASLTANDYSLTEIPCNGGFATLTILNPAQAAGLEYQFNGNAWQTSAKASVPAGANTVRIRNTTNGCYSHLFTVNVTQPAPFVVSPVTKTNAPCYGEKGEVVFNFAGGSAPYAFYAVPSGSYNNLIGSVTTEKTAGGLADYYHANSTLELLPGTYNVAVTANGCQNLFDYSTTTGWDFSSAWEEVTITSPTMIAPAVIAGVVNNVCRGGVAGSIDVDDTALSGGTGPYTVSIDGTNWVAPIAGIEFTGLAAGTYSLKVKDATGCISAGTAAAVTQPDALGFTLGYQDVTCVLSSGGTKGAIWIASATGGSGAYEYLVKPAGQLPVIGDTWQAVVLPGNIGNAAFNALDPTYYSVYVRDANNTGCMYASFANQDGTGNVLPIQTPGELKFTTNAEATGLDVKCNGDGFVLTASGSGGSGAYTYAFSFPPTPGVTGTQGTGANANKYTLTGLTGNVDVLVTVSDANPSVTCSVSRTVRVDVADVLTLAVVGTPTPPTCPGGIDGLVKVLATGSVAPYEYSVDNIYWQSQDDITITEAATTVWVRSVNNPTCKTSIVVDIDDLTPNTLSTTQTNIVCNGTSTGAFTVNTTWLAGRTISYYYSADASKVGTTNVASGTGVFLIASGADLLTATKNALPVGTYYVWAMDEYGCVKSDDVVLTQNPALNVSAATVDATCYMKQDGLITITANAGSGSEISEDVYHQYAITQNFPSPTAALTWKNFDSYVLAPTTNVPTSTQLISAAKGTYYVFVKDESCISTNIVYTKVEVGGYDNITTTANPVVITNVTCNGKNNGKIELSPSKVSGGQPGSVAGALYSFTLVSTNLTPAYSATNATGSFMNLKPGNYTLTLTDAKGCNPITFSNLTVTEPGVLAVTSSVTQHFTCAGMNDGIIHFDVTGGTPPYQFAVNSSVDGTGNDITVWVPMTGSSKNYVATEIGNYIVYVKDAVGECSVAKSNTVVVKEPAPLTLTTTNLHHVSCPSGNDGSFDINVTAGGWSATEWTQNYVFALTEAGLATSTNYDGVFTGLVAGTYVVYVGTTNTPGSEYPLIRCKDKITVVVNQPTPYKYQATITPVLCKGEANGTLKIKVLEGGTPDPVNGYQVAYVTTLNTNPVWMNTKVINDPDGDANAYTFTGLPHAIYTVMIKDANGCIMPVGADEPDNAEMIYLSQESFEINEPALALTASVTWNKNITCYGGNDGKFTVTAAGGSGEGTYMYAAKLSQMPAHELLASELVASDWQASPVFDQAMIGTPQLDGTFIIWVKDANGCIVGGEGGGTPVDEWRVKISQPAQVAFSLATNSPRYSEVICYGATTGTITASVSVGAGYPYTIRVQGTSAAGAAVDLTKEVTSGAITMTGLPATETSHAEPTPAHTTHNAYTVTITDKNGCSNTGTIQVWQNKDIVVSPLTITAGFKCPGDNNGFIETTATGGSGAYSYQLWRDGVAFSGWVNISSFAVEVGHTYAVLVKDASSTVIAPCEKVSNTINIVAPIGVTADIKEVTCYGDAKASIVLSASGDPGRTFEVRYRKNTEAYPVLWTPITAADNRILISNLTFANINVEENFYYFQVRDNQGCLFETPIKSFVPTQHPLEATVVQTDLNADLAISGGISPYTYVLNNEAITTANNDKIQLINLKAGTNVITIYDAHYDALKPDACFLTKTVVVDPVSVTAVPASGNNQPNTFNVVLTFNRTVTVAEGDITGGTFTPGTAKTFTVAMAGDDLATLDLVLGTGIVDAAGNTFAGATFPFKVGDHVAPTVVVTDPVTPVPTVFTVGLKFSEPVSGVLGGVTVTGGTLTSVEGLGDTYTVKVSAVEQKEVTIVLSDAIMDMSANTNKFAGLTLKYTTGDFTAPALETWTPLDETIVGTHPTFKMTFSEDVEVGTGNLTVYKVNTTVPVLTIPVTAAMVNGKVVTVTYAVTQSGLDKDARYYVLVDGTALKDKAGNAFTGVSDISAWTFKTGPAFTTDVDPIVNGSLEFKVYPNPFVDYVNVANASELSKIVVTNIAGQTVKEVVNPTERIQLNELRSGIYFMSLYNSDDVVVKTAKIVKR